MIYKTVKISNFCQFKLSKRSQASGAAALVAVIAALIILYIIFIPPEERAELLGEKTKSAGSMKTSASVLNLTLLEVNPGTIHKQDGKEIEHLIPSLSLNIKKEAAILKTKQFMLVQRSLFKDKKETLAFNINDVEDTEDVLLNFYVKESSGKLIITLNEKEIYISELKPGNIKPIKLLKEDLKNEENLLEFSASSIGVAFWRSHEYDLESVQITADLVSKEGLSSENIFLASQNEKDNLDEVYLKFVPECTISQVGKLNVDINGFNIYSAVPDCGKTTPKIYFSADYIKKGQNIITFRTDKGSYIIDLIKIISKLKEARYPVYYFEIDDDYFAKSTDEEEAEENCGDADGICPDKCDETEDLDCCFESGKNMYWCDVMPADYKDRCVTIRNSDQCSDCPSGYEDDDGNPPEECEELCGDDTDNSCPSGCNKYYDMDCCFEEHEQNYWCDNLPKQGLESVCEESLSESEYNDCLTCYFNDDGDEVCPEKETEEEFKLKSKYDAILKINFVDDTSDKVGKIVLNNHIINFDQTEIEFEKKVDAYLEEGNNALRIEPLDNVLEIVELKIILEED